MKKILVTGGAGFIGSNLVKSLLVDGNTVRLLDNFSTGNIDNIKNITCKIEVINGNILNDDVLEKSLDNIDVVIHLAARPSVPFSIMNPIHTNDVNIDGTLKILEKSKQKNIERFIFASSSSVYGSSIVTSKSEYDNPNPLSPYALQKLTGEYYCKLYYELYNFKTIAFRFFNVFGANQNPNSQYSAVIPLFISKLLKQEAPTIHGGEQTRDFTFVEDVINGIKCGLQCVNHECFGQVYNLAKGDNISIMSLFKTISEILKINIDPVITNYRAGDVKHSKANPDKIKKYLNWKPQWSFEEAIAETIKHYQKK